MGVFGQTAVSCNPPSTKISMNIFDNVGVKTVGKYEEILQKYKKYLRWLLTELAINKRLQGNSNKF